MRSCRDHRDDAIRQGKILQAGFGKFCTLYFVVGALAVINDIVKPNCQFYGNRILGETTEVIELGETIADMVPIVVMTIGSGIS